MDRVAGQHGDSLALLIANQPASNALSSLVINPLSSVSLNCLDCQICRSAEGSEPRTLSLLELAKDTTLKVDKSRYPFILVFQTVVGRGEYHNFCVLDFSTVSILHFVVPRHKHPAIFMTETDDFWVFHVPPDLAVLVSEPFRKSLDGESGRPQADSHGFG